jgi:hypothetical protein
MNIKDVIPCKIKEEKMSDYKFDGRWLKSRSGKRIAQVDKDYIKDDRGARVGKVDGKKIKDARGSKLAEYDGKYIKDKYGRRIGGMKDVKANIKGDGGISLVALWLLFVR